MHPPQSLSPLLSSPSLILQNLKKLISVGSFEQALSLFNHLHSSNLHFQISPSILPSLLKASSSNLPFTLQLHSLLLKSNLVIHPPTLNSLLYTYSKHSDAVSARKLFDEMPLIRDPITWGSMISSYSQNGYFLESLKIFKEMSLVGLEPKPELIAAVVSACSWRGNLSLGRAIHGRVVIGSVSDECVLLGTSLIDMYMKFWDLDSGLRVFGLMFERNVVSWTAVINGCVSCGNYNLAIDHLRRMRIEGVEPNRATMVSALQPCGELGALKLGKEIHGCVFKHGFDLDSKVTGAMINMYSRCVGGIKLAYLIFERAKERDTITWSSMLAATSMIGDYGKTFELFQRMRRDGVEPNSITMLAIIDACIGLASLDHGLSVLSYSVKYGLISDVKVHGRFEIAEELSRELIDLEPKNAASYALVSMVYADEQNWDGVKEIRRVMRERGLRKNLGCSRI
ncbi:uncharacterized protein A4U43_C01F310 [Asparagus officinalis]|uniref:Pentacotripeptide-repeat region of PRORP domain-containing protein n=1 Tax=Asparagus officinalis TaxID=4686 RepID=A0A5P1FPF6_ASPOF|nr:uncharacterized protein A4U43_C01F310 [Asparagus officinalis]